MVFWLHRLATVITRLGWPKAQVRRPCCGSRTRKGVWVHSRLLWSVRRPEWSLGGEVVAVPGGVLVKQNRGGHALIRDKAKVREAADDILEET